MILSTSHRYELSKELGGWLFLFFFFEILFYLKRVEKTCGWTKIRKKKNAAAEDYKGLFILTDWAVCWRLAAESRRYFIFFSATPSAVYSMCISSVAFNRR